MFENEHLLNRAIEDFKNLHKNRVGIVAKDIPLLSNLSVLSNISLIRQYHRNMNKNDATLLVMKYLKRLDLERIASLRNYQLADAERFCVMLLRAVMIHDAIVVIDRPFLTMPHLSDAGFLYKTLTKIEGSFRETHIFDYQWNSQRYNIINDVEKN